MALHNEIGQQGEGIAIQHLIDNGYVILDTNWRFKKSEIDIIAQKEDNVVFVEVKTRTSNYFQNPEESVTLKKQKQILIGANHYVQSIDENINLRFDIISVIISKNITINHLKDAFYPVL